MFKESFKYYKSKCLQTDLTAVIDVDKVVENDSAVVSKQNHIKYINSIEFFFNFFIK